ncbi:MAG TPA: sigma-70 family RNA polymerase sigma factor [Polyangiaceae bacterium]|nr:sigma-70 family RNA polymerase sigma factor [Polyangiaceae bacterium]
MTEHASSASMAAARAAWPGVHVADDVFAAYVDERLGPPPFPLGPLSALYVACACVHGDRTALQAFDDRYMPDVVRAIQRMRLPPADVADVAQSLRQQLLAGPSPRLAEYAGRGELGAWLRVIAVRAVLKRLRGRKPEAESDDALLAIRSAADDPELGYMKELYRHVFRESFGAAVDALDARDKVLLRQHFVDGLGVDDLAPLHHVHRATVARWLQRSRERLLDETRREFMKRARLGPRECDSVLRMVRSRIDVTLGKLLARSR